MAESWEEPDPQEKMADAIKQQSNTMRELFLGRPPTPEEVKKWEARRDAMIALGEARWPRLRRFRYWFRRCPRCLTWRPAKVGFHDANDRDRPHSFCMQTPACLEHVGLHPHFLRVCLRCAHYWWEQP